MSQLATPVRSVEAAPLATPEITLLELVAAVAESASSDAEVVAAVSELINSGKVRLVGNFRGADVRVG
jgi:hypothetical protein